MKNNGLSNSFFKKAAKRFFNKCNNFFSENMPMNILSFCTVRLHNLKDLTLRITEGLFEEHIIIMDKHLYIDLDCLSVWVSVFFVSNKRQYGSTDQAQIFCGISRDPREGL